MALRSMVLCVFLRYQEYSRSRYLAALRQAGFEKGVRQ